MIEKEAKVNPRIVCIINPEAANKKWKRNILMRKYIQKHLPGKFLDTRKDKESTIQTAKSVCADADIIVAAGGDGTIADVIQGIVESERRNEVALGIIPLGSGNAFRISLGIPLNIPKALRTLDEAIPNLENAADPELFRERARLHMFDRNYSAALEQLARAPVEVKDDQFGYIPRSLWYAQVYSLMGRRDPAQAYYDSTRMLLEAKIQEDPEDSRYHSTLGITYAGLGRREEALRAGQKGVELLPISKEALRGYYREVDLAIIYTMVGEYEAAIDNLAYLLSIPGDLSVPLLRIDPTYDPLREYPRFKGLVAG